MQAQSCLDYTDPAAVLGVSQGHSVPAPRTPWRSRARGSRFSYPEWLILLIAVLAVKCKVKSYLGIHQMAVHYWPQIAADLNLPPISESQLRERLKKICHTSGRPAAFIFQIFPASFFDS
jgi:hypothetical protein